MKLTDPKRISFRGFLPAVATAFCAMRFSPLFELICTPLQMVLEKQLCPPPHRERAQKVRQMILAPLSRWQRCWR